MARLAGVGVERFSIGFGPVLWRVRGKETEYCVSAIPMGGYVKMMGDDENPLEGGKGAAIDPAKAFNTKPLIARFLIVFAGPAMNFILAAVIAALMFMVVGRPVAPAEIGRVTEGGPAAQAGSRPASACSRWTASRSSTGRISRGSCSPRAAARCRSRCGGRAVSAR
jgi:regulator of sigma E protease